MSEPVSSAGSVELPTAERAPARGAGWTRLLPLVALVLALVLVRRAWQERGQLVHVRAADGHGLAAGDAVRTLGIEVGRVDAIELAPESAGVRIDVRLARSAGALARGGTRFWIARPVVGVEGVRGLETALGSRYLAVLPGPAEAAEQREFVALEEPPLEESEDPGALEIVLLASARAGLARGAPLTYRGIPIGALVSVGLAEDATAVEVRARVRSPYAELVRTDSRFARVPGVELSFGLHGLELALDSLQSLWLGGVALATPTHPGPRATTGQRFELADVLAEDWASWRPALPVGSAWLPADAHLPPRVWAQLTFERRGWFARARSRGGWLVRDGDAWLGPADLLVAPEEAEHAALELGGARHELAQAPEWSDGTLARRVLPGSATAPAVARERELGAAEDLLLCADPALAPMAVAAEHLTPEGASLSLAASLALDERWHGAVALARKDGAWLGILLVAEGRGRIVPVPR